MATSFLNSGNYQIINSSISNLSNSIQSIILELRPSGTDWNLIINLSLSILTLATLITTICFYFHGNKIKLKMNSVEYYYEEDDKIPNFHGILVKLVNISKQSVYLSHPLIRIDTKEIKNNWYNPLYYEMGKQYDYPLSLFPNEDYIFMIYPDEDLKKVLESINNKDTYLKIYIQTSTGKEIKSKNSHKIKVIIDFCQQNEHIANLSVLIKKSMESTRGKRTD